MPRLLAVISLIVMIVVRSDAFTLPPVSKSLTSGFCNSGVMMSSLGDSENQQSPAQKKQEKRMEMSSIAGAEKIRGMEVAERTKRAMLAEAVEDRIFEIVDELDELVKRNNGLENLTDEVREEAVEMAKQTQALQIQYDDLVSGKPSELLDLED